MPQTRTRPNRPWVIHALGVLLGLSLFALGCLLMYRAAGPLWQWYRARTWIEVPASIKKTHWKTTGHQDDPYEAIVCRYAYAMEGTLYEGSLIAFGNLAYQPRLWHLTIYRQLMKANQQGAQVSCFVDRRDPKRAVLFRDLQPAAMLYPAGLAILVLALGAALTGMSLYSRRSTRRSPEHRGPPRPAPAVEPLFHVEASGSIDVSGGRPTAMGPTTPASLPPAADPAICPNPAQIQHARDEWGNERFRISCWPGAALGIVLWLLALLCTGFVVLLAIEGCKGHWLALPFVLLFAAVAVLLWRSCLSFFGAFELTVSSADLLLLRDYVVFSRHHAISMPYVQHVTWKLVTTRGRARYYAVGLVFADGHTIHVASSIRGEAAARWLAQRIQQHLPR